MNRKPIPFSIPYIDEAEIEAVSRVLKSKWITSGDKVKQFELAVRNFLGVNTAVAVSSGTAALDISLAALGVQQDDEIITTAYTFASTVLSIIHLGARPVLCDVESETFNIDPRCIEETIEKRYQRISGKLISRITGNPLKGIVAVHYSGQAADMGRINRIAAEYNLFVVEDAAHAIGGRYHGKNIGQTENLVCFSFYSNKNLTTGEGGMVVTHRTDIEEKLRMFSLHGITKSNIERYDRGLPFYDIRYPGYKANMSDINAAIGLVQLNKLTEGNRLRNQLAGIYDENLSGCSLLTLPRINPNTYSPRHLYPILLHSSHASQRDEVIVRLKEANISASVHFIPVHWFTYFKSYFTERLTLPVSEDLYSREISLPLFPELSPEDVVYVCDQLKKILEDCK